MKFKLYINWKNRFRYNFIIQLCKMNQKRYFNSQKVWCYSYDMITTQTGQRSTILKNCATLRDEFLLFIKFSNSSQQNFFTKWKEYFSNWWRTFHASVVYSNNKKNYWGKINLKNLNRNYPLRWWVRINIRTKKRRWNASTFNFIKICTSSHFIFSW